MKNITTFEEHLTKRYGIIGTAKRDKFEQNSKAFALGEMIKEARKQANLSQEELDLKSGTTKSFISRIENGQSDIQLGTLFRIVEIGLGKELSIIIM